MCIHVWIFFLQNWGPNPSPNLLSDILNSMEEQESPCHSQELDVFHKKVWAGDFPGGPAVKTPCGHGEGQGFSPWSGN